MSKFQIPDQTKMYQATQRAKQLIASVGVSAVLAGKSHMFFCEGSERIPEFVDILLTDDRRLKQRKLIEAKLMSVLPDMKVYGKGTSYKTYLDGCLVMIEN